MRKCCVIGCRSGYDNNSDKFSAFRFPSEEDLRKKWLLAVGRRDFTPSNNSGVCEKHFVENDIVRHELGVDNESGLDILIPIRARLKYGAVPSLNFHTNIDVKLEPEPSKTTSSLKNQSGKKRSHDSSSSDEDMPLGSLRNRYTALKSDQGSHTGSDNSTEGQLQRKIADLLSEYEKLKDRHVALGQAIDVLERINIELKCKIFKF